MTNKKEEEQEVRVPTTIPLPEASVEDLYAELWRLLRYATTYGSYEKKWQKSVREIYNEATVVRGHEVDEFCENLYKAANK